MIELLAHQDPYVAADICAIIEQPAAFDGKRVSISGVFMTDWRHARLIVGDGCELGIWFLGDLEALGEPWDRIAATRLSPEPLRIRLTVEGRYEWDPTATGTWAVVQAIMVERIVSLEITPG